LYTERVGSKCSRLAKIFQATIPFARFAYPPARHAVPPPGEDKITLSPWSTPVLTVSPCFPRGSPWPKWPLTVHVFPGPRGAGRGQQQWSRRCSHPRPRLHPPPPGLTEQRVANGPLLDAQLATPSHGGHFRVQFGGEQPVFTSSPVGPWRPLGSAACARGVLVLLESHPPPCAVAVSPWPGSGTAPGGLPL
jgi:hypothetical protein